MANFNTHFVVGATVSGVLAITCLKCELAPAQNALIYFIAGTIGGILPDIDSDHSTPTQIIFGVLGVVLAFMSVFARTSIYSIAELSVLWLFIYWSVRHGICQLFSRYTIHRGIFHSLLASFFFATITSALAYWLFSMSAFSSWMTGLFVGMGSLVHLSLDEIYAVNLMGASLKKSFGSALKLAGGKDYRATVLMASGVIGVLLVFSPPLTPLADHLTDGRHYKIIAKQFFPEGKWFKDIHP